jgi:protein TonB
MPVPVRMTAPVYPFDMRREGVVGIVRVACVIDEQGNVTDPSIESSTHNGFNAAAIAALKKWKFKAATIDGVPVAKRVVIPLKFAIEEK